MNCKKLNYGKYFNNARDIKVLACSHCGKVGIKQITLDKMNEYREFKESPVIPTSGYRCPEHPESIKYPESSHIKGLAWDEECSDSSERDTQEESAIAVDITRRGYSKNFSHRDIDPDKPGDVMWVY